MLPESFRPFVPGHSEPERIKTWPRSQKLMLSEPHRPFVPGDSESERVETWP